MVSLPTTVPVLEISAVSVRSPTLNCNFGKNGISHVLPRVASQERSEDDAPDNTVLSCLVVAPAIWAMKMSFTTRTCADGDSSSMDDIPSAAPESRWLFVYPTAADADMAWVG